MNKRPAIKYTMAWLCTFQIGRETEAVVFMTDDFDTILKEYEKMKAEHQGVPVIFTDHKLIGKGRLLISDDMLVMPQDIPEGMAGEVLAAPGREPVINADEANAHPRRVQRMANEGRFGNFTPEWMEEHNRQIAERQLGKELPPDKV
jgi:hypothetical protein